MKCFILIVLTIFAIVSAQDLYDDSSEEVEKPVLQPGPKPDLKPPQNIKCSEIASDEALVTWENPHKDIPLGSSPYGPIKIYWGTKEDFNDTSGGRIYLRTRQDKALLHGLDANTTYGVSMQIEYSVGNSPESDPIYFTTRSEKKPEHTPQNVECKVVSPNSVHVTWKSPPEEPTLGPNDTFKVLFRRWGIDGLYNVSKTTENEMIVGGLESNRTYEFIVRLRNLGGDGAMSFGVMCDTLVDIPSKPLDFDVEANGTEKVIVSWKKPYQSSDLVSEYTIYYRKRFSDDVTTVKVPASQMSYEILDLAKNQKYEFWMSASSQIGEGLYTWVTDITLRDEALLKKNNT